MALNIGQGILDKMHAAGDVPLADSEFGANSDGQKWEKGVGLLGNYRALQIVPGDDSSWRIEGPLGDVG